MLYRTILFLLIPLFAMAQDRRGGNSFNFRGMLQPVPDQSKFEDDQFYIWGGSLIKDRKGLYHLYYSRWEKKYGFNSWVSQSEVAHATAPSPFGPFTHQNIALSKRDPAMWDGMSTHNPTIHKFGSRYYLYYTGNTGDGKNPEKLNFSHRNNQRIGVAVADDPNGPWKRFDCPLIDVSPDSSSADALMVSNPSVTVRPDGSYLMVYKAVGKKRPMPFGGPVVHLTATSQSPEGPFVKQMKPVFIKDKSDFPAEDPYIWQMGEHYYAIVKDMHGAFTQKGQSLVLFKSKDGFEWNVSENELVSDLWVEWENGTREKMSHLERPQLYIEEGVPVALLVAADKMENGQINSSYNIQIPLAKKNSFLPGKQWNDEQGRPINAHGGGIIRADDTYYWYGEHKLLGRSEQEGADGGVHCYSSSDLYNWKDLGLVLSVDYRDKSSDISVGCILERPKVLFNKQIQKYVMYFKLYPAGTGYDTGYVGVAVSDRPEGPFIYSHKFLGAGSKKGSGDFCMFQDEDGSVYHLTVRKPDKAFCIGHLRSDYLYPEGEYKVLSEIPLYTEAPAVIRIDSTYYMVGSGSTGWKPNTARSFSSGSIWEGYKELGNPCVGINSLNGMDKEKTFGGQISFILPVDQSTGSYIAMFDIWKPDRASDGLYIWLPLRIEKGKVVIEWSEKWSLPL